MSITKPYRRTVRQFKNGSYGEQRYIKHPKFAKEPQHYVRAFEVIQKDLIELFDYVEPSDANKQCFSYRIHQLFMRTCIEVEANFKAILRENGYGSAKLTMADYKKCEQSHKLSQYQVKLPVWQGVQSIRTPFSAWKQPEAKLPWFQDYNEAKHDRHGNFELAKFENLVDSFAGLVALLSSQFSSVKFTPPYVYGFEEDSPDGFENAVGDYFQVKYPTNLPDNERYDFDWAALAGDPDPIQNFPY